MPAATAVLVVIALLVLAGCGASYDEQAHRAELEAALGHPVSDWPTIRDVYKPTCAMSESGFGYFVAIAMDEGGVEAIEINIRHTCPERLDEVHATLEELEG